MVDPILNRLKRHLDLREIHHPTKLRIDRSSDMHFNLKTMPMHPPTLMSGWNIGQPMRRLNAELLKYLHHDS
jgi:hypothetical protein